MEVLTDLIDEAFVWRNRSRFEDRFSGGDSRQVHRLHQAIGSSNTDLAAIFNAQTAGHLAHAQSLFRTDPQGKNLLTDNLVLKLARPYLGSVVLVVGTTFDMQNPAEGRDAMLMTQRVHCIHSFPECGVNMAIAFFRMRFSSSSWALRFWSASICWGVTTVSSSVLVQRIDGYNNRKHWTKHRRLLEVRGESCFICGE